ncbi:MAG: chitobiase/beta-hexosaminidase C-terminal domain-containing protein [Sphaerochaeta sp.]
MLPNNLELAKRYVAILTQVYKYAALTSPLESGLLVRDIEGAGANEVSVGRIDFGTGLKDYSKTTGYGENSLSLNWETFKLMFDRSSKFNIDAVDNIESMDLLVANTMAPFIRRKVVPEVDALRFSKWARGSDRNTRAFGPLSSGSALKSAISAAVSSLNDREVSKDDRYLCLTATLLELLKDTVGDKRFYATTDQVIGRKITVYDDMKIIEVPQSRFYSHIQVNANGGFSNAGKALNFMILDSAAVFAVTKRLVLRVWDSSQNQDADAYKFAYRLYHDAFCTPDLAEGIYVHAVADFNAVEEPVITITGNNTTSVTVKIDCATAGASIYYTTDGSTPTTSDTEYTGGITDTTAGAKTIKAIATKAGLNNSVVASKSYTVANG